MLIDTHCHLTHIARGGDVPGALARAQAAGIRHVVTIGTSTEDWEQCAAFAAADPGRVSYTIGLHPCDVGEDGGWRDQVSKISGRFSRVHEVRPVALGEIGLDRFHLPADAVRSAAIFAQQEQAFRAQLALAREINCPVVIHSRDAFEDCVRIIDESGVRWSRVVFHCFAHGPDEVRVLNGRGGRASFTGIITYKNAESVRAALIAQGPDLLMLETDAPYLAPAPHRGQPNEPALLTHTAEEAARQLKLPLEEIALRTTANAIRFFGLRSKNLGFDTRG